jgi:hypothetical protein
MPNQLFIFTFDYHWSLCVFHRREGCAQTWEHNCGGWGLTPDAAQPPTPPHEAPQKRQRPAGAGTAEPGGASSVLVRPLEGGGELGRGARGGGWLGGRWISAT